MTTTDHLHRLDVPGGHLTYLQEGAGTPPVLLLHAGYLDRRMYARETAHLERGPALLIGTSMGGAAAVDVALEHPELVHALLVCGAGTNEPSFESPEALELLQVAEQAIGRQDVAAWLGATLAWSAGPDRSLEQVDQDVVARLSQMNQDFVATHIRPGVVPPEHVTGSWDRLGEISVPVLGVVGELDFVDHHRMTERLVASVPDGRGVVRIPGAGHFPNLEQPLAWEQTVDRFLDDVC